MESGGVNMDARREDAEPMENDEEGRRTWTVWWILEEDARGEGVVGREV